MLALRAVCLRGCSRACPGPQPGSRPRPAPGSGASTDTRTAGSRAAATRAVPRPPRRSAAARLRDRRSGELAPPRAASRWPRSSPTPGATLQTAVAHQATPPAPPQGKPAASSRPLVAECCILGDVKVVLGSLLRRNVDFSCFDHAAYLSRLWRADERTRTADLLITSDHSGVAGVCTGLQIPHF